MVPWRHFIRTRTYSCETGLSQHFFKQCQSVRLHGQVLKPLTYMSMTVVIEQRELTVGDIIIKKQRITLSHANSIGGCQQTATLGFRCIITSAPVDKHEITCS